jgi:hypothetical protein
MIKRHFQELDIFDMDLRDFIEVLEYFEMTSHSGEMDVPAIRYDDEIFVNLVVQASTSAKLTTGADHKAPPYRRSVARCASSSGRNVDRLHETFARANR